MRPILTTPPMMAQPGYRKVTTTPFMPAPGRMPTATPPRMQPIAIRRPRFYGISGTGGTRYCRPGRQFAGLGDVGSSEPAITDTGMRGFLKWAKREYPAEIYQQIAAGIQERLPQAFSGYMLGGWRKYARMGGLGDTTVDTSDAANSTASDVNWANDISQIIGTATGAYLNVSQQQNQNSIVQAQLQQAAAAKAPLNVSLGSSGITFGTAGMTAGGVLALLGLGFVALKAFKVL